MTFFNFLDHWQTLYSFGQLPDIGMMVRVFTNVPVDLGSIPGRVIPKFKKMLLDAIRIIRYISRVKRSNLMNGVVPSPTPWSCSY